MVPLLWLRALLCVYHVYIIYEIINISVMSAVEKNPALLGHIKPEFTHFRRPFSSLKYDNM